MMKTVAIAFFGAAAVYSVDATARGAIGLDTFTFDKIVDGSRSVVVKFDKQYAYGDQEDAYKAFAKEMAPSSILVAEVGVQDYGDKENDDLREKYGVKADDFPVFKIFKKGGDSPSTFTGEVTNDNLKLWTKEVTGVWIGLEGTIEELDRIAVDLAKGTISFDDAVAKAKKSDSTFSNDATIMKTALLYVRIFEKIKEKGTITFAQDESKRVKGLLAGKNSDAKKKMLELRLRILASFKADSSKDEL
jgi:endoplasmic reticulum protein 29